MQQAADASGIGSARYNKPSDVVAHPHLTARDRWRDIDSPVGPLRALLPPPVIAGYVPRMGAIPALGEHTRTVLRELGVPDATLDELRAAGVIGAGRGV